MSEYYFLSSDKPFESIDYTQAESLSIEEAESRNIPLPDWYSPDMGISRTDKILIYAPDMSHFDEIQIWDKGDSEFAKKYSNKRHHAGLQWRYSDTRATQLIEYIKAHLESSAELELWKVWLDPDCEASPIKQECRADFLTPKEIKEYDEYEVLITELPKMLLDAGYKTQGRPYCLAVSSAGRHSLRFARG